MSAGQVNTPLTGAELVALINSGNTKQIAYTSLATLAEYIATTELTAEMVMIGLLQDISKKLDCLSGLTDEQVITNDLLKEVF